MDTLSFLVAFALAHPAGTPTPTPAPAIAPAPAPAPKPTVTVWRLADARGQAWTHTDRAYLERWVRERNAVLTATDPGLPRTSYPPPILYRGGCPNGRCPR